jgi:hypothetical protein
MDLSEIVFAAAVAIPDFLIDTFFSDTPYNIFQSDNTFKV